jgi:serine incorporator 1/3
MLQCSLPTGAYLFSRRLPLRSFYNSCVLSIRNVVKTSPIEGGAHPDEDVYIGRSEVAMWMRVVSSWVCMVLYIWSLVAPVLMPDR